MAIIPIYTRAPIRPGERPLFALTPEDYDKVRQGYGCAECLEDFNGVYMMKCPVCGHIRQDGEVVAVPEDWRAHVDDLSSGYAPKVATADEFIRSVMEDSDIEHWKL